MLTDSNVAALEKIIGYKFNSKDSISIAVTHPGLKKNTKASAKNFERLEFLGDRVLGLSLATFLYETFGDDSEGELAVRMAT